MATEPAVQNNLDLNHSLAREQNDQKILGAVIQKSNTVVPSFGRDWGVCVEYEWQEGQKDKRRSYKDVILHVKKLEMPSSDPVYSGFSGKESNGRCQISLPVLFNQ